ncbi:M1 family aminopeptidase [Flavobacterium ardleyense]|uniref:Aminopeptidase N n=1 Tax=Flavobacterium ardleyense TaxID=2038737 RepID=A0ABW5Z8F8_9FLAO
MKKNLLYLLLLSCAFGFAQDDTDVFERMVQSEMRTASSLQNFVANANTANYDIIYHELRFTVDPSVNFITGKVTSTFKALAPMNKVTFDLTKQLVVSSVKSAGVILNFVQNTNNELVITLPRTLATGNPATVVIEYSGVPASGQQAFTKTTHNGNPIIYTLSEPFGARDWWPCKQDLKDKVDSIDVYITSPSPYIGVTNGKLVSSSTLGGKITRHFKHGYPIPAYLISLNVSNFASYNFQAGLGNAERPFFPIINYLYPESNTANVRAAIDVTAPIMNVFEEKFGLYPYRNEQYGHVQFGWGGGMEHTTMSSMGSFGRSLIAHELGHQWFGNKITCGSWKDVWLNEGLTEYAAGIVVEELDGAASFVSWKNNKINTITSQSGGAVYLTDAEAENVDRIFSSRLSYDKGAMVTHMLRWVMGDVKFFQALKSYLNDTNLAFGYALTGDLKAHLEAAHGSSLTEFFNDWIYKQGYPTYNVNAQNWGAGQAKITVGQTQSNSSVTFFEMPLEIRLKGAGGATHDVVVNNTTNNQQFIVSVPFKVTGVTFDPNKHIISRSNSAALSRAAFEVSQTVSVYPNPANDQIHIMMPSTLLIEKIEIYNTLGQLVGQEKTSDFSVSELSAGLHVLKISTSEGVIHKNFIKK